MSTLADWKEIMRGDEQDVELARKRVKDAVDEYLGANQHLQDSLQLLERSRRHVAGLESQNA